MTTKSPKIPAKDVERLVLQILKEHGTLDLNDRNVEAWVDKEINLRYTTEILNALVREGKVQRIFTDTGEVRYKHRAVVDPQVKGAP